MDLVSKENKVFTFSSPGGIFIGFELLLDVSRVNGDGEIFHFDDSHSLCDEVREYLRECFEADSLSEVVESCVRRGVADVESAEEGESNVVFEFKGEVSFGISEAEVDEEESFEEGDGVVAVGASGFVFVLDEVVDEGEIDGFEEDFERVIFRDKIFSSEVYKGELEMFSHYSPPFCSYFKDRGEWGYGQGGGHEKNKLFQWVWKFLTG